MHQCGICERNSFELLWELPKLPLTEKYGKYNSEKNLFWNQSLVICNTCGHVQLGMQIPPNLLYTPTEYSFRTSQSASARKGIDLFLSFFQKLKGKRTFQSLLDIGGNDLFLVNLSDVENKCVIDPVCIPPESGYVNGVKVIAKFIEQVNLRRENISPDLIFCRHVLEHIANPKRLLQNLFEQCKSDALYIFEIPCLENLMQANRFDAIFHQHYHYLDVLTFKRLIHEAGGSYIGHAYNRQGSCGGTLLIAFDTVSPKSPPPKADIEKRTSTIKKAISNYKQQMRLLSEQLKSFHQNIYGYGASLMLATLAYHLDTDFSELICVLDDDIQKDRIEYINLPVTVRCPSKIEIPTGSNFIITSLENTRTLFNRIIQFTPQRVLLPLVC